MESTSRRSSTCLPLHVSTQHDAPKTTVDDYTDESEIRCTAPFLFIWHLTVTFNDEPQNPLLFNPARFVQCMIVALI
jgi:hypothetical protein